MIRSPAGRISRCRLLARTGYVDTFARDHLPPADLWPVLEFTTDLLEVPGAAQRGGRAHRRARRGLGPDRPALRTPDGDVWTYGELRARANQIAQVLTEDLGLVPGNRVLLRSPNNPWTVAAWLGVLKAGGVVVTTMAALRARELGADRRQDPAVDRAGRPPVRRGRLRGRGERRSRPDGHRLRRRRRRRPDPPGRRQVGRVRRRRHRGRRRGAARPRRRAAPASRRSPCTSTATCCRSTTPSARRRCGCGPTTWSPAPRRSRSPSASGMLVVFTLRAGACAFLTEAATPAQLADIVAEHGVTVLATAPTAYKQILRAGLAGQLAGLRTAVSAGEHIPREHLGAAARRARPARSSTASARPRCCTSSSPRPATTSGRARPASRCPASAPPSSARTATRLGPGDAGTARRDRPGRLPLPGRRAAAQLRRQRLERHRRHLLQGRRRLLLLPGAHRQHDRLLRLQHRRPRGRGGHRHAPRRPGVRGGRHARTPSAARSSARSSCCGTGVDGRRREGQGDPGPRQERRSRRTSTRATSASPTRCRATPAASCSTSRCARSSRRSRRPAAARQAGTARKEPLA